MHICWMLLHKQATYPVFLLLGRLLYTVRIISLDEASNCEEVSKDEWQSQGWKEYVNEALRGGPLRGVVAAAQLINKEAMNWVGVGEWG